MWEEKSTPNSRNTPAVFCITGVSDRDPNIMAAFITAKLPCFKGENKGAGGSRARALTFCAPKFPQNKTILKKNNRNGEKVKEIHSFFLLTLRYFE
jgi:hypothetical protein